MEAKTIKQTARRIRILFLIHYLTGVKKIAKLRREAPENFFSHIAYRSQKNCQTPALRAGKVFFINHLPEEKNYQNVARIDRRQEEVQNADAKHPKSFLIHIFLPETEFSNSGAKRRKIFSHIVK